MHTVPGINYLCTISVSERDNMGKEITENQIDFSVLSNMDLPAIEQATPLKLVSSKDQAEIKEDVIGEIESIEAFNVPDKVTPKEGDTEIPGIDLEEELDAVVDNPEVGATSTEEDISVVKGIAEWAKTQGILEYDTEKFQDTEDWLKEAFTGKVQKEVQAEVSAYKESLPGVIKDVLNNYEEGVPLDELIYSKSREIEYNGINEKILDENKDLQKRLVADWLANQDYTQEEIEDTIKKYDDSLLLDDQAKIALKKLKVFEQRYQANLVQAAEQNKKDQQTAFLKQLDSLEKEIMASEEIIPGIKTTPEERKKIFESYTKTDSKKETALIKALKSDPKAWFKITQFMVLMNGNLDSVKTKMVTEATNKVKSTVGGTFTDKKGSLDNINLSKIRKAVQLSKKQTKY